jgi:hypothetical protein
MHAACPKWTPVTFVRPLYLCASIQLYQHTTWNPLAIVIRNTGITLHRLTSTHGEHGASQHQVPAGIMQPQLATRTVYTVSYRTVASRQFRRLTPHICVALVILSHSELTQLDDHGTQRKDTQSMGSTHEPTNLALQTSHITPFIHITHQAILVSQLEQIHMHNHPAL